MLRYKLISLVLIVATVLLSMAAQGSLKTMSNVVDTILKHEGGYQNDRNDAANKNSKGEWAGTNYGITPAVYEEEYGKAPSASDMKKLSKDKARSIYEKRYVKPVKENLGISEDHPAFEQVVDMAVNHGYSGAVALVQRAAGAKVDGKAGPGTRKAIAALDPAALNEQLVDARVAEYQRLAKSDPAKATFLNGWLNRAETFRGTNGKPEHQSASVAAGSNNGPSTV